MKANTEKSFQSIEHPSRDPQLTVESKTEPRLYRLKQVLQRIPVSRSTWFAGIKTGRFPKGHHLGLRTTVWHSHQIDAIVDVFDSTRVQS